MNTFGKHSMRYDDKSKNNRKKGLDESNDFFFWNINKKLL